MSFVLIFFIAALCCFLYVCIIAELPPLFTLLVVAAILYFGYLVYLNIEADTMALWDGITSAAAVAGDYLKASLNDLLDGMTAWGWIGFGLSVTFGMTVGFGIAWPLCRALAALEVRRLKRERDQAREEADREREKARQAEQARQRDRAIIANVKRDDMRLSRQAGKDRGQRISAVGQLQRRREREDKMRKDLAQLQRSCH